MKVNFVFGLILLGFVACTNEGSNKEAIRSESELLALIKGWSNSDSLRNPGVMQKYTLALDEFLDNYPDNPEHENFLFLAANNLVNLRDYEGAAAKFARYSEKYPDSRSHAESLIAAGFLYNNEIHNLDSARKYYETFVITYPDHMYTEDIKSELQNLGKTPEEMLDAITEGQDSTDHRP